jgi:hypothetical protein
MPSHLETNQRSSFSIALADAFHNAIDSFNPSQVRISTYLGRIDNAASPAT